MAIIEIPSISLHLLVQELQPTVTNAFVSKIQAISENAFKFKLSTRQGNHELVLTPGAFFITEFQIPPTEHHANFVQLLRKHVQGKKIMEVHQQGWDRIVVFEFEKNKLVLELFAEGNLVLLDAEIKTLATLHTQTWKDRQTKRNVAYRFPVSKPIPADVSFSEFAQQLKQSDKKIVSHLMAGFNLFPPLAEEAVLGVSLAKEIPANALSATQTKQLYKKLCAFFSEQKQKPLRVKTADRILFLPFSLPHWIAEQSAQEEPLSSLNQGIDAVYSPLLFVQPESSTAEPSKRLQKLLFSLQEQRNAREKFEKQILENHQKGEWVYQHFFALQQIQKGLQAAQQKGISSAQALEKLQQSRISGIEIAREAVGLNLKKKRMVFETENA